MSETRYTVVIEEADGNLSAYVPDLPGCVSTGNSIEDVTRNIGQAIAFHLEGMREDGLAPPPPRTRAIEVGTSVP